MACFGSLQEVFSVLAAATDRSVARRFALTLGLVVAGGFLGGAAPLALKNLVDAVPGSTPWPPSVHVWWFGALYLLAMCASRLLTEIRPLVASGAEQRIHARLRQRFFNHLLSVRLSYHLERRTGAVIHTLHQALTGYQLIVVHGIHSVVPVLVEVLTAVVVLLHLGQPALTATFAATAVAYVVVFSVGATRLRAQAQAVSDASLSVHATIADGLLNCETIKCFGAEPTVTRRLDRESADLEKHWQALHRRRAAVGLALTVAFTVSTITSLWLAIEAVGAGTLTIGGFVLANVYMLQVVRPLETMGLAVRDLAQAQSFIRPLLDLLQAPIEAVCHAPPPADPIRPMTVHTRTPQRPGPRLRYRSVHFSHQNSRPVLEDFDLDIEAGRHVAIVGASGSGKSTAVRLLLRLFEPSAGCILLDEKPINELPLAELRSLIGLVPQDVPLFNDTVAANIGIGRIGASRSDIEQAARIACLHDVVASLPAGYDTSVGERGLKMSGGERQRIAIARAVLKRPSVYLFDEATSMLDSRTEAEILRGLSEATTACTTITIAHRLSTVRHADAIVVLQNGRVAESGNHAELLTADGAYARLWLSQLGSERM